MGETTETQTYANATFSGSQIVYTSGDLRGQSESDYDQLGRVYESRVYEVEQATDNNPGQVGDYLATDTWYDPPETSSRPKPAGRRPEPGSEV